VVERRGSTVLLLHTQLPLATFRLEYVDDFREFKHSRFETWTWTWTWTWTASGSELFSLLTRLHTIKFTMLSTFSRLWMISIKMCETPLSWHTECSLPVAVRVSKTSVLKLPFTFWARALRTFSPFKLNTHAQYGKLVLVLVLVVDLVLQFEGG